MKKTSAPSSIAAPQLSVWRSATVFVLLSVLAAVSVSAQTVKFRSPNSRITAPLNYNGTISFTNVCTASSLVNPVDLSITGLPTGASATITTNGGAALPVDNGLPSLSASGTIQINVALDGTVAEGLYLVNLNASSGAVNNWPFYLQVGSLWSGTDYVNVVSTNWEDTVNWVAGAVPGPNDDVVFGQLGATNAVITNIIVNSSTAISSLRFAPTNSSNKYFTMLLNPGVTLGIRGSRGFSMMKDLLNAYMGLGGMTITMTGIGGAVAVTNETANVFSVVDNAQASTWDMSGLGNFVTDVNQVLLGDCVQYPNFRAYNDQNGYSGIPRQSLTTVNFARTNVIKAIYADPNNYTNSDSRHWSFSWMNSELTGSSTAPNINFGISNIFYVDSINLVGGNSRGNAQFNSIFNASNPIAIFRGTNGGRMTLYSQSDGGGTNTANSNIKSTVQFLAGTLDMLVDQFYIGRDRVQIQYNSTPNYQGFFLMGRGILDVNTMILGYREHPGAVTNTWVYNGYCEGQFTVSNGLVRVNNSLTLGYTKETNPNGLGSVGNTEYGQVTIRDGGTMLANTINVGGPVYNASKNNFIIVTNSGNLTVSNFCGSANQSLDFIAFANGSALTLALDATNTAAAIWSKVFNMTGSNSLVLTAIRHPGSLTDGMQIPVLKITSGSLPNFTFINQSGINGQIVTDPSDPNQQDFQVILSSPKTLVWKGYSSAIWDNSTYNWLDTATGLHTNFAAGDNVIFDDSASQFTISLDSSSVILPGSLAMTNNSNAYVFSSGGGSIVGSSILQKYGANNLQIDCSATISINVSSGSLTGAGSVGSVSVGSGGAVNFTGTIAGNLSAAGTAIIFGTVNGAVEAQNGGIITNAGTMNNGFIVDNGGLFVNNPGASMPTIGASAAVSAGGTLVNRGTLNGVNITVSGTCVDTGEGNITLSGTFTATAGATIIPGGYGIGTTTIQPGSGTGFPGRVLLSSGSTNIFKVDIVGGNNTKLLSGFQDFGGSTAIRSQDGATIIITNVTGNFAIGQSFTLFGFSAGGAPLSTGTSTNRYPIISPATPGPGMAWDLTQLWQAGAIGVVTNLGPVFTNSFALDSGTNIIGQFTWDQSNYGWRLQNKVVPNSDISGLASTNPWTGIPGSWTNTTVIITNTIGTNSVYYRLVFP